MAVISDDAHAVQSSTVCAVTKADAEQPPPFDSAYYVLIQLAAGSQSLRWSDMGQRDEFYKRLIDAMEKS